MARQRNENYVCLWHKRVSVRRAHSVYETLDTCLMLLDDIAHNDS